MWAIRRLRCHTAATAVLSRGRKHGWLTTKVLKGSIIFSFTLGVPRDPSRGDSLSDPEEIAAAFALVESAQEMFEIERLTLYHPCFSESVEVRRAVYCVFSAAMDRHHQV